MDGLECFDLHPFSMAVKVLDNIFHNLYEIITETIIVPYDRTSRREVSIYHAGDIPLFPTHPQFFFPSFIQEMENCISVQVYFDSRCWRRL